MAILPTERSMEPELQRASQPLLSIRNRSVLILAVVALLPALFVAQRLGNANRNALRASEQNLQAAVLAEVSAFVRFEVENTETDVRGIAGALASAANGSSGAGVTGALRSLLANTKNVQVVRFEVPDAGVDSLLAQPETGSKPPPVSTPETRAIADKLGVARTLTDAGVAITVPVAGAHEGAPRGYLTGRVSGERLADALERFMLSRFSGIDPCALVAQGDLRVVVARCASRPIPVGSRPEIPLYANLGSEFNGRNNVGAISEFSLNGEPYVGGVQVIGALNWTVAIWRPQAAAYSALTSLQRELTIVLVSVFLLSIAIAVLVAGAITQPIRILSQQVAQIARRDWDKVVFPKHRRDEIGELSKAIEFMVDSLKASEIQIEKAAELKGNLSRFLSKELVDGIVKGEHSLELGGTRREVTVMFADIVGFTGLAERQPPERVVVVLNELFSMLSEVVFRHGGVVDKFIGDCIMAVWGSAVPEQDHAASAVAAALDMLRFLETANIEWVRRYGLRLELAIGINTGDALVGNVGSLKRMEYTVIGDAVNVAARLEKLAGSGQILMGARTRELIDPGAPTLDLGEQTLFGKGGLAHVYRMELG